MLVSFYHFHWYSRILTLLPNPITHLLVSSLEITKKRFYTIKSGNFIGHNIFSSHLHKHIQHNYILKFLFKSTCLWALISFFIPKFILKWGLFLKWAKFGKKINTHDELQMIWRLGPKQTLTRGVWHCGLAIYIKKYLKSKEELCKLKYCTIQKYNLQKSSKKNPKSFKIL